MQDTIVVPRELFNRMAAQFTRDPTFQAITGLLNEMGGLVKAQQAAQTTAPDVAPAPNSDTPKPDA